MASSPPAPLHATLPNPKKRPSLVSPHSTTSGGSSYANKPPKRPKLHPLRQTSYPDPNAIPFSATPSARSETGSLVSGISSRAGTATGTGEKRRRGRPKKGGKERDSFQGTQDGTQSTGVAGGDREDARTLVSARSGPGGQGSRSVVSARSGDEEDEGEGEGAWATAAVAENLDAADKARKEEEEREENRRLIRLMSTFTPEQEHRHLMYKRSTLNKTQLKRIVNQTVSQSVTALPLIAIGAYSKFFVGEIVTRALDVQKEWAAAFDANIEKERERQRQRQRQRQRESEQEQKRKADEEAKEKNTSETKAADVKTGAAKNDDAKVKKTELAPNPHKGGLLPDHLREALRRYKADGEGGGVGFGNTSLGMMGNQGAGTWRVGGGVSARRLFR